MGVNEKAGGGTSSGAKASPRKTVVKRAARPSKEEPQSKKAKSGENQSAAVNTGEVKTSACPPTKAKKDKIATEKISKASGRGSGKNSNASGRGSGKKNALLAGQQPLHFAEPARTSADVNDVD